MTTESKENAEGVESLLNAIQGKFYISPVLFIVPGVVIFLIIKKVSAIPALFIGTIIGAIAAVFFQPEIIREKALFVTLTGNSSIFLEGLAMLI